MTLLSNDISTHLQALFHTGLITGYIQSRLAEGSLRTGWIEQGLLSKGMKGNLRDKHNQEFLAIPADRFARLARDCGDPEGVSLAVLGSKGISSAKFVAMVFGTLGSQTLIAFQIQKSLLADIVQLLLKALGKKATRDLEDANLDYIEQLRLDANEGTVKEAVVLSLPKKQEKISGWMKDALLGPSSDSIEFQHGDTNKITKFAALVTRWLSGLELFKTTNNAIAALLFIGRENTEACFWDQPQRIAAFTSFHDLSLESISLKYLNPLWIVPGESLEPPRPAREVTVEPIKPSIRSEESSPTSQQELVLDALARRLDSLETRLSSSAGDFDTSGKDRGKMDLLQTKLSENIERIESLSKRLNEIEARLKKIRT